MLSTEKVSHLIRSQILLTGGYATSKAGAKIYEAEDSGYSDFPLLVSVEYKGYGEACYLDENGEAWKYLPDGPKRFEEYDPYLFFPSSEFSSDELCDKLEELIETEGTV